MDKRIDARYAATMVLTQVIGQRRSLSDCLPTCLEQFTDQRDRALTQALCYGVLRWLPRLEMLLKLLLNKPLKTKDCDIYALLLIGLYQLLYLRIPIYATTAATVEVATQLSKQWAKALVNGILRTFQRQRDQLLSKIEHCNTARFAHPQWLLNALQESWPHEWQQIVAANNDQPPMTLRVNARQVTREKYLEVLKHARLEGDVTPFTTSGITLTQAVDVEALPHFAEGWVSVQDGAAQLAAELLDVPQGARVLDACAAPGGKTAHILERFDVGKLVALEIEPTRAQILTKGLERLKLHADIRCADASQVKTWWDGQPFDCILLDVPCSASGVIRRHPDIKHLRQLSDIPGLVKYQAELLGAVWPTLLAGGKLVYVTCSVFAEENHLQLQRFLSNHSEANVLQLPVTWGHKQPIGWQILPGEENFDGFYYACLTKRI